MRPLAFRILILALAATGCGGDSLSPPEGPRTPAELIAEGRRLFFEETFGGNGRTCGTCHPEPDFTIGPADIAAMPPGDPLFSGQLDMDSEAVNRGLFRYPLGGTGFLDADITVLRGVPSIANLGPTAPFLSDGRAERLEDVSVDAVLLHALDGAVDLPGERIPTEREQEAMAAFQLSVALPDPDPGEFPGQLAEMDGFFVFTGKARCVLCHVGPMFTDNEFHNQMACPPRCPPIEDPGRCRVDPAANDCAGSGMAFNTPQLRGVGRTAPFFHDNAFGSLEEVVEMYNSPAFHASPAAMRLGIPPLDLTPEEIEQLVEFLNAL